MNNKYAFFSDMILSGPMGDGSEVITILNEDDNSGGISPIPNNIPILPLRNTVLFPGIVIPISVSREKSVQLIRNAYMNDKIIGTIAQIDQKENDPKETDLYKKGTIAQILKIIEMPDSSMTVIIQGRSIFEIKNYTQIQPYFRADIIIHPEVEPSESKEFVAIVSSVKDVFIRIIQMSMHVPAEAGFAIKNIDKNTFLINYASANSEIKPEEKQQLLEICEIDKRGLLLLEFLNREVQLLVVKNEIQSKTKVELDQQHREYILHQQMKTIQDELGGNPADQEVKGLEKLAETKKWSQTVADTFKKELDKLKRINPNGGEYSVQLNYLHTLIELPWNEFSNDNFDMKRAEKILEEDHFGLEKVKDRILEHLAVLKLKGDMKAPILCLVGPPGVGKTSLGKSIARALERKYCRMSLGGLHDESEIRGHRKTYIGAMPGRIIQNLKKAKTSNPVFILDEIDKLGQSAHGDPSSALLEVLDPEQNSTFNDNFVDIEFDLSKIMFIATANSLGPIQPALRDRMEIIDISGYTIEEKSEIASRHLLPKQIKDHGLESKQLNVSKESLEYLIENYTRESGVRELNKTLASLVRNITKKIAFEEKYPKKPSKTDIQKILGIPRYSKDKYQGNDHAGVVTGLAWTSVGGDILYVESSLSKGKGTLTLTGNLGNVMKESAILALEYLKAHSSDIALEPDEFEKWNVHIHVPEGAIPKDGPSAGVTMITSIASAFTRKKVRHNLAMTGEITLRGRVLPVGGIKEKILAAKRAGITDIMLCIDNKKDIEEIKEHYLTGLSFHYVKNISEVLKFALLEEKVEN